MKRNGLILASKSEVRRRLLENAGVPFTWRDSAIDEDRIKRQGLSDGLNTQNIALALAEAKAAAVLTNEPSALVLGCDQILALDGKLYDKPRDLDEARTHLKSFRNRTHHLVTAAVLLSGDRPPWRRVEVVTMSVRPLSDAFIDDYLASEGNAVLSSVGAYRLESMGAQLFERIDGDFFTVLGLPLLPLLEELRNRGMLPL